MTRKRSRQNFNNQTDRLDETQDDRAGLIFGKNTVLSYLEKLNEDNVECEESGINKIFLYEGATGDPRLGKIKKLAKDLRIPAIEVAREKIDALSGPRANHQGVVASLSPIKILSQAELLELIDRELESLKALE
ncbi:MAG: hypothetical protein K8F91_23335, partial [Candidatus Obscuribacterales bacterium]|nr:hypothetical protein [Candidatus Obscuribacterales bacterium]